MVNSSSGNAPFKGKGKITSKNIFTFIWNHEYHQAFTHEIMTNFNLSRQALNYHMNKLLDMGLVTKLRDISNVYTAIKSPYETEVVKIFSGRVRNPHIRSHAIGYQYKILSGSDNIKFKTNIKLRNWVRSKGKINGCTVIKHPNKLLIYAPEQRSTDAHENIATANKIIHETAQEICDRYKVKLGQSKLIQAPHHAVISEPTRKAAKKIISQVGTIRTLKGFIDDSESVGGEVEFLDADDANTLLNMPSKMKEIDQKLDRIVETQVMYAENIKLHLDVMKEIKAMIKSFNKRLGQTHILNHIG